VLTAARLTLLAFAALINFRCPLAATDLETTHLFGFTRSADTNNVGEKEAESETTGRFGKSGGSYAAVSSCQVRSYRLIISH
jgi:hypothetical protein